MADPAPPPTAGPRATRLRETHAHALRRTLDRLADWDSFSRCFPTVAAAPGGADVLRQVQAQMVEKLGGKCEKEFENILAARGVIACLNELEGLLADAATRRQTATTSPAPTPPHLLRPRRILAAHLQPALAPHEAQLKARLGETRARNAQLAARAHEQRAELAALLDALDRWRADLRGANAALAPLVEALAEETRRASVEAV